MLVDGKLLKLNTEVYGGPILMTWLDRPLSVAGRVVLKGDDALHPQKRLVDLQRPIGVIPSIAIHFNRAVNDGVELNKQRDMPLLTATIDNDFVKKSFLLKLIADELAVDVKQIIDCDLYLYDTEKGTIFSAKNDMVLSPKLDDLSMVYAGMRALQQTADVDGFKMLCIFDNEEVGSCTKQGAAAPTSDIFGTKLPK